ncbi:MAG TPA: glycosyltransferase family 9 protein [Terriglobales bacterium]|nr:glycosyltransferase family 9 protein [Terriglobales bacterium]
MEKLLILRLGSMGDIVHALPGAAALRRAFPSATIGWAVEQRWSELLCAAGAENAASGSPEKPLVDTLHFINTVAWRKALFSDEMWKQAWSALSALRAAHYELAVDFQGAWKSAGLALWSAAPERVGFDSPRERPAAIFYTHRVRATVPHVVDQGLELAAAVAGKELGPARFPLPCSTVGEAWCNDELRRRGLQDFALLGPGGGWGAKLWPAENYGQVAAALAHEGLPSLINFGPGEEELARAVEEASGGAAQPLSCSLRELIALARRARLFIGGDSGPMHLAAALGVPVVAIFGPTDPARNGPYGTRSIVLRHAASTTSYTHHDRPDEALQSIPAEEVVRAALRLLEAQAG